MRHGMPSPMTLMVGLCSPKFCDFVRSGVRRHIEVSIIKLPKNLTGFRNLSGLACEMIILTNYIRSPPKIRHEPNS